MQKIRKRIYEIIEIAPENDRISNIYDIFMMFMIVASLVPLLFKHTTELFLIIDDITVVVFIVDYLLRWITADLKIKKGVKSFIIYPFTFLAIIDLLSILPSLGIINNGFKALKVLRLLRTFRALRALKILRYSKSFDIIVNVLRNQKKPLLAVVALALGYIFVSALIVFNIEPETFGDFSEAIYWATVSLTTVGYGDIYPITSLGRIITMVSSVFGVAIVALPSGIITAGYMHEIELQKKK